ncbi:hypothetical protein HO173_011641 [Letharia columbiana]|uniref:Uncharacterized protein n=1 Tax=Letharia columbiana TaxID=112416 RepID=A0A8H6CSL8_9LECA|nr:uncharacterized protein HO173_011641 [Letharia columbiana]KAF6228793.1 hypothetical protein HO173_011641 [Letharia columbiana]
MGGGLPIWRCRPASTLKTVHLVPIPTATVFRLVHLNTKSQRAAWIQENTEWSRTLVRIIQQRQQRRIEVEKAQDRAGYLPIWRQQPNAQEKPQIDYEKDMAEQTSAPACYERMWSVSFFGLIVSGLLYLILFTTDIRDSNGGQLGGNTTCDLMPRLTDGSTFSIVYWTAVAVDIVSRSAALMAVVHLATSSKALYQADAASYTRLYEYTRVGNHVGVAMAVIPLGWDIVLTVRGKCEGEICSNLALATMAVMNWTLLASIVGALFLDKGYRFVVGGRETVSGMFMLKKKLREGVLESGRELLGQGEQDWA